MKVQDVCSHEVLEAHSGQSLEVAASRMDYHAIGALLVKDGSGSVGILTERDVLHAVAEGLDPDGTTVGECMSEEVIPISLGADVEEAAVAMVSLGARHLPVSDHGEIVGMISARDLLAVKAWEGLTEAIEAEAEAHPEVFDLAPASR